MFVRKSLKLVSAILLTLTVLVGLGYAAHKSNSQSDRSMAAGSDGQTWP
jgi:hypothetical protein